MSMGAGEGGPWYPQGMVLSKGTAAHLCLALQGGPCRGAMAPISGSHTFVPGMASGAPHPSLSIRVCLCLPIPSVPRVGTTCCPLEGAPLPPVLLGFCLLPAPALLGTLHS